MLTCSAEFNSTLRPLFRKLARFHLDHTAVPSIPATNGVAEPPVKKRKISPVPSATVSDGSSRSKVLELNDISFTIPQRKKLTLTLSLSKPSNDHILTVSQPKGGPAVCEIAASQIAHAFKLPVPEKTQKQWNYIILPKDKSKDALLWTIPVGPVRISPEDGALTPAEQGIQFDNLLEDHNTNGPPIITLTTPSDDQFVANLRESHRKSDKCYHVKAFRGSKDGFLFFLSSGIFFGFKKPLLFLSLSDIESISYTSVLQRTFNLDVVYKTEGEEEEVEFSMLDQAEFGGIDEYVKRHGLNDASLAEGRRAKLLGGNKKVNGNGVTGEGEEEDGRTELEKVEQQLQDAEDEMEEDFELDSEEGSSDGSGDDDNGSESGDLVEEELGSEAEDVEDEDGADDQEEPELEDVKVIKPEQKILTQLPRRGNEPSPDDDDQL